MVKIRTGENIRKRKDGRWEARYHDSDGKIKSLYAGTYTDVKEKLRMVNTSVSNSQTLNQSLTVKEVCNLYLFEINGKVKKSTYANYYQKIEKHISKNLGKIELKNLKQKDIDRFINNLTNTVSEKTVKDIVSLLKQCLNFSNLTFQYKIPTCTQKEMKYLNTTNYDILLNYLLLDTTPLKLSILLALCLGLRLGEICALQWSDIDFQNKVIHINKTVQRIKNVNYQLGDKKTVIIIDKPKSVKSIRTIPLTDFFANVMQSIVSKNEYYIITGSTQYMEPRQLQYKFKQVLAECHIQDINFHALRHTFATMCFDRKLDVKTISEILGHSTVNFTLDRYVHTSLDHKRTELEKLMGVI